MTTSRKGRRAHRRNRIPTGEELERLVDDLAEERHVPLYSWAEIGAGTVTEIADDLDYELDDEDIESMQNKLRAVADILSKLGDRLR